MSGLWLQPPGTVPSGSPAGLCSVLPCPPPPPPVVTCASKAPSPASPRGTKSSSWWTSRTSKRWVRRPARPHPPVSGAEELRGHEAGGRVGSGVRLEQDEGCRLDGRTGGVSPRGRAPLLGGVCAEPCGPSGDIHAPRAGPSLLPGGPAPGILAQRGVGGAVSWAPAAGRPSPLSPLCRLPLGPETFPWGRLSRLRHFLALSVVSRGAGTGVRRA